MILWENKNYFKNKINFLKNQAFWAQALPRTLLKHSFVYLIQNTPCIPATRYATNFAVRKSDSPKFERQRSSVSTTFQQNNKFPSSTPPPA